jgi:hypothetical protein
MQVTLSLTADERHSCRRAAVYVRGVAAGLADSSDKDASQCLAYAVTLEEIAGGSTPLVLGEQQKIHIEQASFLLEGVRNGLDNAELDTGCDAVQRDIERLNDLVLRYNSEAASRVRRP